MIRLNKKQTIINMNLSGLQDPAIILPINRDKHIELISASLNTSHLFCYVLCDFSKGSQKDLMISVL
jgi:hypothetical protein